MARSMLRGVGLLVIAWLCASCGLNGRDFVQDERIRIDTPRPLQLVKPPFVMRWAGQVKGASRYAVFVDRAPMAPDESLRAYAERQCDGTALCPTDTKDGLQTWLEQRGVFEAGRSKLEVPFVTTRGESSEKDTRSTHEAVVVALGPDGRRIGESAWATTFRVAEQRFGE